MDRETEGQGTRCPIVHITEVFILHSRNGMELGISSTKRTFCDREESVL